MDKIFSMTYSKKWTLVVILIGFFLLTPSFSKAATNEELIRQLQSQIAALQAQINILIQQQDSDGFHTGDRVRAEVNLKVRRDPSTSGGLVGTVPIGSLGTLECDCANSGIKANDYTWWHIRWDNGLSGWSVEGTSEADYINKVITGDIVTTTKSIQVIYPNGGEQITFGSKEIDFNTTWRWTNLSGNVSVYLNFADGANCYLGSAPISQGHYYAYLGTNYQCQNISRTLTPGQYRVRLVTDTNPNNTVAGINDVSDGYFTITNQQITPTPSPSITILSPNGGESYKAYDSINVKLHLSGSQTPTTLVLYLINQGGTVKKEMFRISDSFLGTDYSTGTYPISPDIPTGSNYLIRAELYNSNDALSSIDESNAPFSIIAAPVVVTPSISYISPTSAFAGVTTASQLITIYGSNFTSDSVVNFTKNGQHYGSVYGSSLAVTNNQISFNLGLFGANSSPAALQVYVSNSVGKSNLVSFTLNPLPSTPSCILTTNKTSYQYGEQILLSWTSQNAAYASFQQETSGKDNIWLPGDKLGTSGSYPATASVIGNPTITLWAHNSYGSNSCYITVSIVAAPTPLSISTNSLTGGTVNSYYQASVSASGGTAPYNWQVTSGSLPPGVFLNTNNLCTALSPSCLMLSGTPTVSGVYTFTLQVSSSGFTVSKQFTINVAAAPVVQTTGYGRIQATLNGQPWIKTMTISPYLTPVGSQANTTITTPVDYPSNPLGNYAFGFVSSDSPNIHFTGITVTGGNTCGIGCGTLTSSNTSSNPLTFTFNFNY